MYRSKTLIQLSNATNSRMSSISITKVLFRLKPASLGLGVVMLLMAHSHSAAGDEAAGAATKFFVTVTPSQFEQGPTPQQIEKARRAKDSRPAAEDPEGCWGGTSEGFRLSVRFEKESYRVGEPITVAVLIRNVADKKVFYRDFVGMKEDSPLCQFDVLDGQQQLVARLDPRAPNDVQDGPHIPRLLNPGTQCRYEVNLTAKFKLVQPGKYSIRARRWVHKLEHDGYSQLKSAQAAITILNVTNNPAGASAATHAEAPPIH